MLKRFFHHAQSAKDCAQLCCTKIENFTVKAGRLTIFEDVNIHVHCGQLTAIIGPNGAGKSTLLKAILGEISHTGSLKYVDAKGEHTGAPVIGYVPQYLKFDVSSPTTVLDLFAACLTNLPVWLFPAGKLRNKVLDSLKAVRAEDLIDRRLGALSGGELQRVLMALALNPTPDLLLLDEPVSGVDQNGLEIFYEILEELQSKTDMAIILISHDLNMVAKYADQVILMDKGVVCSGTPKEVFADKRTRRIFGMLAGGEESKNGKNGMNFEWKAHKKHTVNCGCEDCNNVNSEDMLVAEGTAATDIYDVNDEEGGNAK